ncbi:phage major capsid protein, partial [bacterium]|nr:phage major capsid protein [bacterium]
RTASGNPIDIPTVDDTSNNGELVAENAAYATQDVTFSKVTLNAYKFTSKLVLASLELLQDSAIDVATILGNLLGERIGRSQLGYFTTGTGSSQPQGAVTGSAAGVTSASATAIAVDDLLGLVHSVDRAYRDAGAFMMHDSVLLAVRKLKDSTNQPIFTQSYIVGEPDRLFGYPVVINNSMASTVATTNKTVLFGDWSKFVIRDALDIQLVRSDERYMEYGQSAFVALARSDSKVTISSAIKRLTQA